MLVQGTPVPAVGFGIWNLDDAVLREIGARHGKSPIQVTLRWLVQQPAVSAIPRSSSKDHIAANLQIDDFELDAGELQRISALRGDTRIVDPSFAPWRPAAGEAGAGWSRPLRSGRLQRSREIACCRSPPWRCPKTA